MKLWQKSKVNEKLGLVTSRKSIMLRTHDGVKIIEWFLTTIKVILLNSLIEWYEKEFGDTPITKLVRQIVGLDPQAANEAFSEFLSNERLNINQSRFVKLIIDYFVKNGVMDKKVLQEEPFKTVGSIVELFKDNMDDARKIIRIIDEINKNSEDIVGA